MSLKFFMGLSLALSLSTGVAFAAEYGTPEEAKAMLEKAVVAMQEDQAAALAMFSAGEGGFKEKDLYPYCGGPDGNFTAHPSLVGQSLKDLKDKADNAFGEEIYAKAVEDEIVMVPYMWPRPGDEEPVEKVCLCDQNRRSDLCRGLLQTLSCSNGLWRYSEDPTRDRVGFSYSLGQESFPRLLSTELR